MIVLIVCFSLLVCSSGQGFVKVENFYPPFGYQPVKGYEPPNYHHAYNTQQQAQNVQSYPNNAQNFNQNWQESWRRTPPSTRCNKFLILFLIFKNFFSHYDHKMDRLDPTNYSGKLPNTFIFYIFTSDNNNHHC